MRQHPDISFIDQANNKEKQLFSCIFQDLKQPDFCKYLKFRCVPFYKIGHEIAFYAFMDRFNAVFIYFQCFHK